MAYMALPAFMGSLRGRDSVSARALEFTILTAARTGEAIGSTWAEFDLVGKVWTVPADRMKAQREHRVPLGESVRVGDDDGIIVGMSGIGPQQYLVQFYDDARAAKWFAHSAVASTA